MAKDAYYFSHDSNAHNDTKILSMVCDYGMKGYGMFWVMVENLREQGEYKLKHEKSTWKALSMQMQCTVEEVKKFIEDCTYEYALFEMGEDLYFYSNSLNRRMDKYQDIKIKRVEAANKRWSNASALQEESKDNTSALQKDTKEMKGNEIKVNKEKKNIYSDYASNPDVMQAILDFIEMRKKLKKPMTDKAIEMMLKKLSKLGDTDEKKIAILQESVMKSWTDIYELKEGANGTDKQLNGQSKPHFKLDKSFYATSNS
jgi:hypothetical protein